MGVRVAAQAARGTSSEGPREGGAHPVFRSLPVVPGPESWLTASHRLSGEEGRHLSVTWANGPTAGTGSRAATWQRWPRTSFSESGAAVAPA